MTMVKVTAELVQLICDEVHRNLVGITSVGCGTGELEQAIALQESSIEVVGIDRWCCRKSDFDQETRKYKFIIVEWKNTNLDWWDPRVDDSIILVPENLYLPVPSTHILMFCYSVRQLPWEQYVDEFVSNGGHTILVISNENAACYPTIKMMKDHLPNWKVRDESLNNQDISFFYRE